MNRDILIFASDVAAVMGRNRYKPSWEVFEAYWERLDRPGFEKLSEGVNPLHRNRSTATTTSATKQAGIHDVFKQAIKHSAKSSTKEEVAVITTSLQEVIDAKAEAKTEALWTTPAQTEISHVKEIAQAAQKVTTREEVKALQKQVYENKELCDTVKNDLQDRLRTTAYVLEEKKELISHE